MPSKVWLTMGFAEVFDAAALRLPTPEPGATDFASRSVREFVKK